MKDLLIRYLAIGAAGFLGSIARVLVHQLFGRFNIRFPLGTFFINITGSFILGWFLTYIATRNVSDTTRLAIGAGFVGAYTTFSTFAYESNQLAEEGLGFAMMINLIGSIALGILAVRLGIYVAKWS